MTRRKLGVCCLSLLSLLLLASALPAQTFFPTPLLASAARRNFQVSVDLVPAEAGGEPETQAEPFIAANPQRDGHLVAVYQENRFSDGGAVALGYAVSLDGGKRWTQGLLPGLTLATGGAYKRGSDPWVAFGVDDRVYFSSIALNEIQAESGIFVATSRDGGRTWDAPVAVHTSNGQLDDKEAVVADTRDDSPYRKRVYVAWDTNLPGHQNLRISWSDDEGQTFTPPVTIWDQEFNLGVIPLVGPGGVLHAVWSHVNFTGQYALWAARSFDGGSNWSPPVEITRISDANIPEHRYGAGLASAAIDGRTGDLYVVWADARFSPGIDKIVLSRSTDGGATWTPPSIVSDGPADAHNFTAAVAVAGNGRVGVAYYSLRNDPERRYRVDQYLAISRHRGVTFAPSQRVSASSWDIRFAAVAGGLYFLGDYQGLAAGRTTFHPVWVATFLGSRLVPGARQPDVFTLPTAAR